MKCVREREKWESHVRRVTETRRTARGNCERGREYERRENVRQCERNEGEGRAVDVRKLGPKRRILLPS